ncbi:MAG: YicC/YloC family endoribonuclease [Hyphomonas sp.]
MGQLSGMTGFARVTGEAAWGSWAWEAKSVNGRSLDVRVNLPPGAEALEREVKALAAARFNRGSLQAGLRIELANSGGGAVINELLLAQLIQTTHVAAAQKPTPEAIAALLTVKGVVDTGAVSLRDVLAEEGVLPMLLEGAATALDGLAEGRRTEGADLAALLGDLLDEMERLTGEAEQFAAGQPEALRLRLVKQLEELDREGRVDPERFAAEAALAAAKADVREELDRLAAHIRSGRDLLKAGSPAGRKLDFLAQELNREANTLCSKSTSLDLTNAGLGLKGVIDQFKEQSANVE